MWMCFQIKESRGLVIPFRNYFGKSRGVPPKRRRYAPGLGNLRVFSRIGISNLPTWS